MDAAAINTKYPALARAMRAATVTNSPTSAPTRDVVTITRPTTVPPVVLSGAPATTARAAGATGGRIAAGVVGAAVGGAGLGFLGAEVGVRLGLQAGLSQPAGGGLVGLLGWFLNALHTAAVGELIGGAAYLAVGLAAGGCAGVAIYNALHKK